MHIDRSWSFWDIMECQRTRIQTAWDGNLVHTRADRPVQAVRSRAVVHSVGLDVLGINIPPRLFACGDSARYLRRGELSSNSDQRGA